MKLSFDESYCCLESPKYEYLAKNLYRNPYIKFKYFQKEIDQLHRVIYVTILFANGISYFEASVSVILLMRI